MKENLFRPMSETEISINQINDIRMVHIYDLTGSKINAVGCPAIAVYYGENEQINLSEMDQCFGLLVNKVFDIYNSLEDKNEIQMDEVTKSFFENGIAFNDDSRFENYYTSESYGKPEIAIDSTLSKRFLPFVEYLVVGIGKIFKIDFTVINRKYGWRGAGLLSGYIADDIKNEKIIYSKVIKRDDNNYSIIINNFLRDNVELLVNVIIAGNKLEINYSSDTIDFSGKSSFSFDEIKVRETHIMYFEGKQIFYDVNDYESMNLSAIENETIDTFFKENVRAIYKLPFELTYVLYSENHKNGSINTDVFSGEYIWAKGLFSEVRGWTNVHNESTNITIKTDSIYIINTRIRNKKIQTYFVPGIRNSSWQYKSKLEGRYFIGGIK